ncbi:hypothetical protein C1646_762724 [Rhizophagus diaphanus]|nr:hypothetical protein C1646_762724 [Rhizophagus diaphanus] [Rhizophagus sp. MUCL 43196]
MYLWLSLNYDIITIIAEIIFRFIFHSTSEKNDHNSILIRSGILTLSVYVSIKEWIITFLFNTKHLFSEPFISTSPRDFWSTRWQLLINESFKELGYLPVKILFVPIFSRKIANIMGVLSAFGISALLHEYLIIANAYTWLDSNKSKNENTMIEKFLKWVLFLIINLILLPALIEPSIRNFDFSDISSISKNFVDYMKF